MKNSSLLIAAAVSSALLAACSDGTSTSSSAQNPLLELVPADTPYVVANLEPVPAQVIDAYIERMAPLLLDLQGEITSLRTEIASGEMAAEDAEAAALMEALLSELDGNMNRQGLESMGVALDAMSTIYGYGMFPVLRAGIGDAEKLRAMMARVETNSGQSVPWVTFQGVEYARFADSGTPMAVYIAVLDDHVAIAAAPTSQEAEFLPQFLALEKPAESLADTNALAELNADKGFSPHGSGYMELSRVVDEMFNPESVTARWMTEMGEFDLSNVDPACEFEARLITSVIPRMVTGATEITADQINMRYQLETNSFLGSSLAKLVADVPAAALGGDTLLSASMNLQIGEVVQFARSSVDYLSGSPFQCPQLQNINASVEQMRQGMQQPLPPFIGNLKGFRAELTEIDPSNPDPQNMSGMLSLEMESPQMVIGMASMMIPGFEELNIQPGADPVAVPQDLMMISTPDMEVYAVMSNDAIGISLGKGQKDKLRPFMDKKGDAEDIFLSLEYDMAMLSELQAAGEDWAAEMIPDAQDQELSGGITEAQLKAYAEAWMGRSRVELRFDGEGLTIDNLQTFD